jgi:hypothetical protein
MQQPTFPAGEQQVPVYDRGPDGRGPRWRDWLAAGLVCLVLGAAGGFALGRATAPSGPKTLAEALQLAQQGKLPRGNLQGGGGFFGGGAGQGNGGNGSGQGNAQGRVGPGGGGLQGQITALSGDTLTVTTQAGELKVQLTGSTAIRKAVSAKKSDLAVGDNVAVALDLSAGGGNGTVTASSITEEPAQ